MGELNRLLKGHSFQHKSAITTSVKETLRKKIYEYLVINRENIFGGNLFAEKNSPDCVWPFPVVCVKKKIFLLTEMGSRYKFTWRKYEQKQKNLFYWQRWEVGWFEWRQSFDAWTCSWGQRLPPDFKWSSIQLIKKENQTQTIDMARYGPFINPQKIVRSCNLGNFGNFWHEMANSKIAKSVI